MNTISSPTSGSISPPPSPRKTALFLRLAFGFAALLPVSRVLAGDNALRVDVVVDMTPAGRSLVRPTPDKPIYYFPDAIGYQELGAPYNNGQQPPATLEVQHLLAQAMAAQGYRFMSKATPPSILLILRWGRVIPTVGHDSVVGLYGHDSTQDDMLTLVGGDKVKDMSNFDPQRESIYRDADQPRYFLVIEALDFQAAMHKQKVELWCARISTEMGDLSLAQVMPALISAGAPLLGQETSRPQIIMASTGDL